MQLLEFSKANGKLVKLEKKTGKRVYSFDILSGFSCPFAYRCLSKAITLPDGSRKIKDGPNTRFRCYSASSEARLKHVFELRNRNFQALRNSIDKVSLISDSLPNKAKIIRLHSAGDFFSQEYFDTWIQIARENPYKQFYAYTKSLPYWVRRQPEIPDNLILTASYGGRCDDLIDKYNLKAAKVVYSKYEAKKLELKIDFTDYLALNEKPHRFALLLHGPQPKGTDASKRWDVLKKTKQSGYAK